MLMLVEGPHFRTTALECPSAHCNPFSEAQIGDFSLYLLCCASVDSHLHWLVACKDRSEVMVWETVSEEKMPYFIKPEGAFPNAKTSGQIE